MSWNAQTQKLASERNKKRLKEKARRQRVAKENREWVALSGPVTVRYKHACQKVAYGYCSECRRGNCARCIAQQTDEEHPLCDA